MPVCITGMHRSGTSMVARLLNLSGLFLGRDEDLINPEPDNPEGYWENRRFVQLNDALLAACGGAWDLPPTFTPGWEKSERVAPLRADAVRLIAEFDGASRWGWKDPRTSLTLPFWQELCPDLRVVICVRNPLEVARSLYRRGYNSNIYSFRLWQIYHAALLEAVPPERRIVTHHEAYFADPQAELARVASWLGWSLSAETIEQACTAVSTSLRHNRLTEAELKQALAPAASGLLTLYATLCAEAGPVYASQIPERRRSPNGGGQAEARTAVTGQKGQADSHPPVTVPALQVADPRTGEVMARQQAELDALALEQERLKQAYRELAEWAHQLESTVREQERILRHPLVDMPRRILRRLKGG
ncbi:MAG: sulfotransferase [Anaerolineae bacterium]